MDVLEKYCKKLKLGSEILEEYENIPLDDKKKFLTNVLEISINSQEIRKKNRLIAEAKFDIVKTFEGYCFDNIQLPEGLTLEDMKAGNFIEKSHNLIFYGSVGTGKTYLATA
ncbi:MAG: ATP-binding protein, partial [Cetobacterium sp.]